jgi:hypothetical protein
MKIYLTAVALGLLGVSLTPAFADEYKDALDRFMITEIMYRYAIMHNSSNIEGYADLFTDDAVIYDDTMHYVFAKGRAQIIEEAKKDRAKFNPEAERDGSTLHLGRLRHNITDPVVTLNNDGKTASSICYVQMIADKPGFGPVLMSQGYYRDQYIKKDGKWLITRRDINALDMSNWGLAKELNLARGPVPKGDKAEKATNADK